VSKALEQATDTHSATAADSLGDAAPAVRKLGTAAIAITAVSLTVFAIDMRLPLGSGMGLAYLLVVLASLRFGQVRNTWLAAALSTAEIGARLVSAYPEIPWAILLVRSLLLLTIWCIVSLAVWHKRTTRAHSAAELEATQALQTNAALKAVLVRTEAAEAQLRRGQRLLDTVAAMARIGGWELDLATMNPIWSQEVYRIHEVDPSTQLAVADALEFYAAEARPVIEDALGKAIEHGLSFDHTVPFITASGQRRWVRTIGVAERSNGVTTRLSGAFQDVTDQHEIQMRLARASRSSAEGHWDHDFGTETVWCSASYEELLGFPARDTRISAEQFRARCHHDDQEKVATAFERHIRDGAPYDVQLRMQRVGGEWRWFRARGAVERDALGRLVSFAGSLIDVHEERLAQDELRQVRARFERAIHGTQDGLWEWDILGDRLWMSPRYRALLGFGEREHWDHPSALDELMHPEDRERAQAALQGHLTGHAPYDVELRLRTSAGAYKWFRTRGSVEHDAAGQAATLSGSIQDITPQKTAEAARVEAEQRLERAIRGSSDGFFEHMLREGRSWYSPRVSEMLGYPSDEALPAALRELMLPQERVPAEGEGQRAFEIDATHDVVYRLPTRQGELRWFRARGLCEHDAAGVPTRFSGSIQDITTQREAEAALVAAKEAAAAANRAKSEFLANMSHEIRTPMNGVLGMTELLLDTPLEPVQREFADTIRTSATSLLGILNDILDLSKIEASRLEIERVEMDVRECVEDVGTMMAVQAAAKNLEFIVNVDPAVPDLVLGDPHRLRQILTNLTGNALKFTREGEIVVEVLAVAVQSGRTLLHFEVHDSGAGMSPEVLGRLFQPFVQADASTTRHYGGTGLGLSIVKRLVELMGGKVSVVSHPGRGSTFSFTLPCELVEGAIAAATPSTFRPHGRRILVVDDNQTNRRVLCGQLRPAGYTVETAGSSDDAIGQLLDSVQAGHPFDVVIADDQMPDSDGTALATRVRGTPGLTETQLIMLTSLDRQGNAQRLTDLGFAGYLTKPVRGRELRACVERVLELESGASPSSARLVTRGSLAVDSAPTRYSGHVLVVEDNAVNQQVTRRFLERLGCEVEVAENGHRAVELFSHGDYDLILMDVQMPVMDGLTATREIRRHETAGGRTPIVALTASAMTDELERCIAAGMDGLLTKPLEPLRLRETLDRYGFASTSTGSRYSPVTLRPMAQAIDLTQLRTIVGDDQAFVQELCQTFLVSSTKIVEELRRALTAGDRVVLGAMAHKLKGGSGSVCAHRVGDLAAALERSARTGALPELVDVVEQICLAVQECAGFIEAQVA
jgi:two-component system sensor histidine kinase/response regulator